MTNWQHAKSRIRSDSFSALEEAFNDIDVDKSGRINRKELRAALQLIGQNPTNEDMKRYMPNGESSSQNVCKADFFFFFFFFFFYFNWGKFWRCSS